MPTDSEIIDWLDTRLKPNGYTQLLFIDGRSADRSSGAVTLKIDGDKRQHTGPTVRDCLTSAMVPVETPPPGD